VHEITTNVAMPKAELYATLASELKGITEGETDSIANLANAAALLFYSLPTLNWLGFYLWKHGELVVGPFQGRPACVRIALGRGVCGTAAERRETIVVPDVNEFPGHIVCDSASRSEIVVPMIRNGELLGVLDVDSPVVGRFDEDDRKGLQAIVAVLVRSV
jgi:L-methionine (R)-S-oxide reductase